MIVRFIAIFLLGIIGSKQASCQRNMLFDSDWRFSKSNDTSARLIEYDDTRWRKVDLPHDWSIENLPGTNSPFDSTAIGHVNVGFTVGGTGWYRKTFRVPTVQKGKRIVIQFDGVYMNANFWINGVLLGNHPYGYTSFTFDITDHLNWDGNNVIAVQVRNEGRNSRWYSGSGIYRHVWLSTISNVHVAQWGTSITTPRVSAASSVVDIKTKIQNQSSGNPFITIVTTIKDAHGVEKAKATSKQKIESNGATEVAQSIVIKSPVLWSVDAPVLYKAITQVYVENKLTDVVTNSFGIRSIAFDVTNGFQLNGKTLKLKGGCIHHDNGPLGSKAYDRAEARKIELLKASGYNAVRTSHNPPSPALLDACDRLGMLVIEEAFDTWKDKKNKDDYNLYFNDWWQKDLESMVYRDRNHPSVIMWSMGNEIPNRGKPEVAAVARMLSNYIKSIDSTRPVTAGVNGIDQKPDAFLAALDVAGYNYADTSYVPDHKRSPERIMYSSESFPLDAYKYWMAAEDHPWVIGDFVWTAFDYIGEASIGWLGYPQSKAFYPWNLAYCGDIDVCGWKRPQSYYRDVLWKKDQLSLFVKPPKPTFPEWNAKLEKWSRWNWQDVVADWNWEGYEDTLLQVDVYSSCESVELFLNNKSLGKKQTDATTKFIATYSVPYAAGELKAVGYKAGKQIALSTLQTAGRPSAIKLTADRKTLKADGQDLSYITVELTDAKGIKNPNAEDLVKFTVEGAATIVGVGNANPKSIESLQANERKAWQGRCLVILKTKDIPGDITLYASVAGLPKAKLLLKSVQ